LIIITSLSIQVNGQKFYTVPRQELELYQLLGIKENHIIDTIHSFEISDFITYREYKKYLNSIRKDSSEQFYLSQLPDTNISVDKKV
jgi:hypothetical protein